ncbi:MAG: MmgE/PrpD family protein [Chloroflexi bacterium]|nr:MmgE/PrpD family protein [Chloroflexota bacterium]
MTLEEQVVRHLRETPYPAISREGIDGARREVLWNLGTSVAGAGAESSDAVADFVKEAGGPGEATIVGFGGRASANMAGLANGVFAKALEYEDKFWLSHWHAFSIGTAVVPAAFAVAEHLGGVSGRDLLRAVALATDVQARMLQAIPDCLTTGWNATYTLSSLGASMAASVLLGLDEDRFLNAMGLAYAQTTGNYQAHQEGALGVRMQMGFGVRNGITAAQLARRGITGARLFLTGKFGLYPLHYKEIEVDLDWLTRDLGKDFFGARLGFKAYPCCAVIHPVLDSVLSLKDDLPRPESVQSVQVWGTPRMRLSVEPRELRKNPRTNVEIQFSVPWAVACALVDRKINLSHYTNKALSDQRYRELAPKVDVDMDPTREKVWAEIQLKDGRRLKTPEVSAPKGHPDNPLSTEEIVEKYRDCVQHGPKPLARENTERAKDLVLRLEEVSDVAEVIRLLG